MMMRSTHQARTAAVGGGLLALTLLLAACSGEDSTTSTRPGQGMDSSSSGMPTGPSDSPSSSPTGTPASGSHNDADVAFATGMVPHHGQAIVMAQMAEARASNAAVKKLAASIRAAQGPEIVQMSGWLAGWGEDVPDADSMATGMDHDMGDMGGDDSSGMGGIMSTGDMSKLSAASGATFDRLWLTGMVAHHEGAVEMSKAELAQGANPDAKKLAEAIIQAQQAEIATMRSLLAG